MQPKRLRLLAPTKLIWIYPDTVFSNANPITIKLTFDESLTAGDITSVSLTGSQTHVMTLSTLSNGEISVTLTNPNGINIGDYNISINNGNINSQNIQLKVKPAFLFSWFDINYPCPANAFTLVLTFNQNLESNSISDATLSTYSGGNLSVAYTFTLGNIVDRNQLSVSLSEPLADGSSTVRGTYDISVVDSNGARYFCSKPFYIGYPYSLSSLDIYNYGVGSCAINPTFTFDRAVDMSHFKKFKMGAIDFTTSTINASSSTKVDVSVANQAAGTYAPTAVDKCDRVISNDANKSIVIWAIPNITSLSHTCVKESTTQLLTVTFASALSSDHYTDTVLRSTTLGTDTALGTGTISGSTTTVSVNSSSIGVYYVVGKALCSQEFNSASSTPGALTFEITLAPTISTFGPSKFDINKIKTHLIFNKAITSSDVVSVSIVNDADASDTYTPTVNYPINNTSRMDIIKPNVPIGDYTIIVTFGCSHTTSFPGIKVVAVPVASSDTASCYKESTDISFTTTFSTTLPNGLMSDAKIYYTASAGASPSEKGTLTMTQNVLNNAVFTLSLINGISNIGIHTYKMFDNSETELSGINNIQITEAYSPTISISVWDVDIAFSFDATFNKSFTPSTQIKSFKLTNQSDNTITHVSTTKTEVGAQNKITVSYSSGVVSTAGLYKVTAIDHCDLEHDFTTSLRITTIPTISSFTPNCAVKNTPFSITATFNQQIYPTQFKNNGASLNNSGTSLTIGNYVSNTLSLSGTAGATAGDFPLKLIDMADQIIISNQNLKVVHTFNPTLTVSPTIYDNGLDFTLTITSVETLVTNQITTAKLQTTGQAAINFTITSQGANQVVLETKNLNINGLYTLTLTDICDKTYTVSNAIRIVNIPVVTNISTICYNQNEPINNLVVTFDKNVYTGQFRFFKIFDNDDDSQAGTGTVGLIGANNVSVNVSNTAITNLGLYYIAFTDVAYISIPYTSKRLRILPATFTINSFTPMTWDSGVAMTLVITFNQTVQDGQVVAVKFTNPSGQDYPVTYASKNGATWTGTVTLPKTNGSSSVMYTLSLTDFCENTVTTSTQLQLIDIPTAQTLNPYCFVKNLSQSISLPFNYLSNIVDGTSQIKSVKLSHINSGAITNLSLGNKIGNNQAVTLPSISSPGNYNVIITDLADQNIPTNNIIRIRNNSVPPSLDSYDFNIWRTDKLINWNLYFSRDIDTDEMETVKLTRISDIAVTVGTLLVVDQSKQTVSFPLMQAGDYVIVLQDICGRTITGPTLTIATPPVITSYSTTSIVKNTQVSLHSNFNIAFPISYFIRILAVENNSQQETDMTLGLTDTSNGFKKYFSTPNVGLPMGVYQFKFNDASLSLTTSNLKILVLDKAGTPIVQSISPNFFAPGAEISFTIDFDSLLLRDQFTSVRLTCADGQIRTMTITGVTNNKLTATFSVGVLAIGDCSVTIGHFNGVSITTPLNVSIVNPLKDAEVSSFSPTCSLINKPFTLTINLNKSLLLGINIASSILIDISDPNSVIPISLTPPANSSPFTGNFNNGVSTAGVYKIKMTDNVNTSITSGNTLKIISQDPKILEIKPSIVRYDGVTVNFSAFFDIFLFTSDLVSVYLYDTVAGTQIPALLTGAIDNEVKVSTINFVPGEQLYYPVFTLCNTEVKGPSFYIQPQEKPVIPPNPTNTTDTTNTTDPVQPVCGNNEVYDSVDKKCVFLKPLCLEYQAYNSTSNNCYSCDSIGQYFYNGGCIEKCPSSFSIYNGMTCVQSCTVFALVSNEGSCVAKCPSSFGNNYGTCIDCVKAGLYFSEGSCVVKCPSGYTQNTSGQCQIAINLYGNTQGGRI